MENKKRKVKILIRFYNFKLSDERRKFINISYIDVFTLKFQLHLRTIHPEPPELVVFPSDQKAFFDAFVFFASETLSKTFIIPT